MSPRVVVGILQPWADVRSRGPAQCWHDCDGSHSHGGQRCGTVKPAMGWCLKWRPDRGGARIVELKDLIATIRAKKTGVRKKLECV